MNVNRQRSVIDPLFLSDETLLDVASIIYLSLAHSYVIHHILVPRPFGQETPRDVPSIIHLSIASCNAIQRRFTSWVLTFEIRKSCEEVSIIVYPALGPGQRDPHC